jgi:hypothetical protein
MAKYSNGKVYKIEAINATEGDSDIYIGSTTKISLLSRFESHRHDYDGWKLGCKNYGKMMSFDVFDRYGIDNCSILLLESYPCNSNMDYTQERHIGSGQFQMQIRTSQTEQEKCGMRITRKKLAKRERQ